MNKNVGGGSKSQSVASLTAYLYIQDFGRTFHCMTSNLVTNILCTYSLYVSLSDSTLIIDEKSLLFTIEMN